MTFGGVGDLLEIGALRQDEREEDAIVAEALLAR